MITFIIKTPDVFYISYRIKVRFLCWMDISSLWLLSSHTLPNCQAKQPFIPMDTQCFLGSVSQCILFLLKKMFSPISICLYLNCPERFNSNVKILWRIFWFLSWTWFLSLFLFLSFIKFHALNLILWCFLSYFTHNNNNDKH